MNSVSELRSYNYYLRNDGLFLCYYEFLILNYELLIRIYEIVILNYELGPTIFRNYAYALVKQLCGS